MERNDEIEMTRPESVDECEEGDSGFQSFVAEQQHPAPDRVEPNYGKDDFNRVWQNFRKDELLSSRARDIAKAVALDGKLTMSEKQDLHSAMQQAHELGCEKEFVEAINSKLRTNGSNKRVYLDTRQDKPGDIARFFIKDRNVLVVDSSNWQVTDSHKFSVKSNMVMDIREIPIPPVKADEPLLVPRPGCIPPLKEDRPGSLQGGWSIDKDNTSPLNQGLEHENRAPLVQTLEHISRTPLVQTLQRIQTAPIGLSQLIEKLKNYVPQE